LHAPLGRRNIRPAFEKLRRMLLTAGVEAAFDSGPASVKAEYIEGEDGETLKRGWYIKGGYMILPKTLQGVIRLDSYNGDTSVAGNATTVWTLGVNWLLATRTKFQVNFEWTRDASGRTTNKALIGQFQVGY
jgi:phosphate-selective porin